MNRAQIERAEKVAEGLRRKREAMERQREIERILLELNGWRRPGSLAVPRDESSFTEEELLIAARVKGNK